MKKLIILISIGIPAFVILYSYQPGISNMKNINEFLEHQVTKHKSPSVYYAFFDFNSIIYEARFGYSRVKEKKPIKSDNTYNIFSITKTFTALAVLQLVQQKKIHLKRPVIDYLPEFPYGKEITVENLLTHTAGIPNPIPLNWIHPADENRTFNRNVFFNKIFRANNKLKSKPNSKFSYSNLGYVILGQLIERVSGKVYEEYVKENITDPLGLQTNELGFVIDTTVHVRGYQKRLSFTNLLLGALLDKKKYMGETEGKWKPFTPFYINGTSYGGLISTPNALVKYVQNFLSNDTALINEETKRILFTEKIINGKPTGMSFSWFTGRLKGNRYYHHAGGGGGYYVELRLYPDLGVGSVILFNRTGMGDERILDKADADFISEANYKRTE